MSDFWEDYWTTRNPEIPDIDMVRYFSDKTSEESHPISILEVGAGVGQNVDWLRYKNFHAYGIEKCREAYLKANRFVTLEEIMCLARDTVWDAYDYIVDIECLTYCSDEEVEAVHHALKSGGRLFSKWFLNVVGRDVGPYTSIEKRSSYLADLFDIKQIESVRRVGFNWEVQEIIWEGIKK